MCLNKIIEQYEEPKEIEGYKVICFYPYTNSFSGPYYGQIRYRVGDTVKRYYTLIPPREQDHYFYYESGFHVFESLEDAKIYKYAILNAQTFIAKVKGIATTKGEERLIDCVGHNETKIKLATVFVCSEMTLVEIL